MNIGQAKEEIKNTVRAYLAKDEEGEYVIPVIRQRPVLLIGPPGIGKTAIMQQIARECSVGLVAYTITHHTRQSAIGLPFIEKRSYGGKEYSVTEYTMSEIVASIYDKIELTGLTEGILFIDEINCVSETLAPTMLQFLQGKTFGNHRIPDGWIIVSAGNPPEYNQSVREFDIVTLDRVKKIVVDADFSVWKTYAYEAGIHGAVISYLDIKKENFYQIETTVDGQEIVTARGWEDLSKLIQTYEALDIPVQESLIIQYIQNRRIAKDFANYFDLYKKYQTDYNVDEVLAGKIKASSIDRIKKASFDEKLSVISLLISRLSSSFAQAYASDLYVHDLFDVLKEIKFLLMQPQAQSSTVLAEKIAQIEDDIRLGKEKGQYEEGKVKSLRHVIRTLEADRQQILKEGISSGDAAFELIRANFAKDTAMRQQLIAEGKDKLANAFAFMETAFGESQEMVIFITEINANTYCTRFIRDNGSEAYDRYNQALLFDKKRQTLLRDIDDVAELARLL